MTDKRLLKKAETFLNEGEYWHGGNSNGDIPKAMAAFAEKHAADAIAEILSNPPKHKYWGAGEPDCPPDIKAPNGEIHTLMCKLCDNPKHVFCKGRL